MVFLFPGLGCRSRRLDTKQLNVHLRKRVIAWLCTLGIEKDRITSYTPLSAYTKTQKKNQTTSSCSPSSIAQQSPRKDDKMLRSLSELYEASGASNDDLSKGGIDGSVSFSSYWYNGAVLSEVTLSLLSTLISSPFITISFA